MDNNKFIFRNNLQDFLKTMTLYMFTLRIYNVINVLNLTDLIDCDITKMEIYNAAYIYVSGSI